MLDYCSSLKHYKHCTSTLFVPHISMHTIQTGRQRDEKKKSIRGDREKLQPVILIWAFLSGGFPQASPYLQATKGISKAAAVIRPVCVCEHVHAHMRVLPVKLCAALTSRCFVLVCPPPAWLRVLRVPTKEGSHTSPLCPRQGQDGQINTYGYFLMSL